MTYEELEKHLFTMSDNKFAEFSKTLSNSDYIVIGVKNPILRQIIKDHLNDEELDTKSFEIGKYLEVDFIYFGLSILRLKDLTSQLNFLRREIRFAKSWAITDCISTYIKNLDFDNYWSFFIDTYKSKFVYERRMAYVLGLKLYKNKEIVKILEYTTLNEEYMVMMAEAWLLATMAIVHEDKVYEFLAKCDDISLKRKAISKIVDSYRFDENIKNKFKELRSKI